MVLCKISIKRGLNSLLRGKRERSSLELLQGGSSSTSKMVNQDPRTAQATPGQELQQAADSRSPPPHQHRERGYTESHSSLTGEQSPWK